eukprot:UN30962
MSNMPKYRLFVKNISQLVPVARNGERFIRGKSMDNLEIIKNGGLCIGHDGFIKHVGTTDEVLKKIEEKDCDNVLDCKGKLSVVPGLVDSHTHPVWSGDRCFEFSMKLKGATYMDIHKRGGGIGYTVGKVHETKEDELCKLMTKRLNRMVTYGTTLVEAKTGYGLDLENEVKMLRVIEKVSKSHALDVVSTYLGAHSIPKGKTAIEATKDIVENQIP